MGETRVIKVKVIPKSPKTEIVGTMGDGTLKIRVAAPPEKGKANAELIAFLAKHYGIPRANIDILTGETSHHKQVRLRAGES
ncbi:MAG: YggU family protein [Acidobacteria bacterium]|nr:YggU family protein [Acidobacteriota bacterium]